VRLPTRPVLGPEVAKKVPAPADEESDEDADEDEDEK
jgi:hypothetical protein